MGEHHLCPYMPFLYVETNSLVIYVIEPLELLLLQAFLVPELIEFHNAILFLWFNFFQPV